MKKTVIIDYGAGNIHSISKAVNAVSTREIIVSKDPKDLESATHIILPGVGAFKTCIDGIKKIPNMYETLKEQIIVNKKWFLGICVGMQLLAKKGYEFGEHAGLDILDAEVKKINAKDNFKIPHMGWNEVIFKDTSLGHKLFNAIKNKTDFYFVHSYQILCKNSDNLLAYTEYGGKKITAIVGQENVLGTQFHPEKSGKNGLQFLENFVSL